MMLREPILHMDEASFRYVDESERTATAGREQPASESLAGSETDIGQTSAWESSVSDITLSLAPGTCTVLCGKSGHGKSTVLRMAEGLAGSYYPGESSGTVLVRGIPVPELSDCARTQGLGVVMQDPRSQFFMGTVADEIAFSLENLGVEPSETVKRATEAARLTGVTALMGEKLTELSSGQKQRVALACAIACKPSLIIMDEPTSNLDEAGSDGLVATLAHLKELGCAILVSEHRLHRFLPIADEFICLRKGQIAARWTAAEFAALAYGGVAPFGLRHPSMALETPAVRESNIGDLGVWHIEDLTYLYPSTKRGISHLTAEFPEGTVTIVEGQNGVGKTTLARVLCGSLKEQSGAVTYSGAPLSRADRRRRSYFVMQDVDYQLYASSVADEVVLGRTVDDALKARAWEALAAFDLTDIAERHPASLSGGQKQRVIMAAAYCSDASLIVLDEPTSGLDGDGVRQVASWCKTIAEQGKAVVVITHDSQLSQLTGGMALHIAPASQAGNSERSRSMEQQMTNNPGMFAKLFHFMQGDKPRMVLSIVLACLGEALGMVPYLVVALLAAGLIEGTLTMQTTALMAGGAAAAHIAKYFLTWRSSMMSHRIAFKALRTMRERMAEKMARVPMGELIDTPIGTVKNRFVDNVNVLEDAIAHFMPELPSNVFGPLLGFVVVFTIDWRMGLASLATIPLGVLFYACMMRDYQVKMEKYVTSEQHMNASLVEYVNGIQVIKAFGRTASSYVAFSDAVSDYHDSTIMWYKQSWVWMAAIKSIVPCTLLAALPLGVLFMSQGTLSLPAFLTCIIIPLSCIGPVLKFAQAAGQIAVMDTCLNVIWDFLAAPELERPTERVELSGETFTLDHVSFSYRSGTEVLHDVNIEAVPGQVTAIVGPSGSGKSTIAKLMAGFWDATKGAVRFGGCDVRDIPSSQLAEHISYVSQDTFLFDMSIADNIRLGRPDATDDEVRAAASSARCHEFIRALPQGYETLAGEAGGRLSGGERQRIAIARAILKDASVIILDEATAYADPENESYVEQALSELVAEKTLVVIAHRLSTVKNADKIVAVDDGRIVGQGSHDELLASCPVYQHLWESHSLALGLEDDPGHQPAFPSDDLVHPAQKDAARESLAPILGATVVAKGACE